MANRRLGQRAGVALAILLAAQLAGAACKGASATGSTAGTGASHTTAASSNASSASGGGSAASGSSSSASGQSGGGANATSTSNATSSNATSSGFPDAGDDPCLPFTMPTSQTLFASTKKVFAHYFYPFPLSEDNQPATSDYYETQYLTPGGENGKWIPYGGFLRARPLPVPVGAASTFQLDNMEREVQMAIARGITGFTVDVLGAEQANPGSPLQNILQAASAVDPSFKIVAMLDLSALAQPDAGAEAAVAESIIESVAASPASLKLPDGRLVVSAFLAEAQPPSWWTGVLAAVKAQGVDVAFVPVFLDYVGNQAAFTPISYGLSLWGTATAAAATATQPLPAQAHDAGEQFMMPVLSQQYRPKDYLFWEASNSGSFRASWTSAIAGGADWVQIVTWSDFSESGQIEPFTDATLSSSVGTGFYDLNAYYASWFLTGQAPTIDHDVLYYFYRREPVAAAAPAQAQPTTVTGGTAGEDNIELLAFLATPGTLSITLNGQTRSMSAPAGVSTLTMPLAPGVPTFELTRSGATVITMQGGITSYGDGGLPSGVLDLTYWTGSASAAGVCSLQVP